jgi:mannitol operon repressor
MSKPEDRLLRDGVRPDHEAFKSYLQEMEKETARGVVIISCATIDDLLGRLIELFFVDHRAAHELLNGGISPLGTSSARNMAAVSLGLINDAEYKDCEALRKIRNLFAHDVRASFGGQRIKDLCKNLRFHHDNFMNRKINDEQVFRLSATSMILSLVNRMYLVNQRQLKTQAWFAKD